MTIATVERVILGPVMLVPHEAGYDVPLGIGCPDAGSSRYMLVCVCSYGGIWPVRSRYCG